MTARLRWILLSVLLLGVTGHAEQVIIRVPPPAATVTIQLPSVSATYDAGVASSIPVSGIATTLTSVTGCTWTNSLGGSGAATGVPNYTWSIASVPLAFGSNVVTIFCADVYLQTGTAVITITRTLPPIPTVTITAPTASPTYDAGTASTITVSGTASTAATITGCTWVNSLGGSGAASGTTSWSVASLPLTIGTNTVTVTCLDQFSQAGNDVIAITRSASGSVSNPITPARMPSTSATLPDSVWAAAGVQGGIPTTWPNCNNAACNALAPGGVGSVTGATIQAALNGAQVGGVACSTFATACVVRIRTVTASFAGGFSVPSFHVVRGTGANTTALTLTTGDNGTNGDNCGYAEAGFVGLCGHPVAGETVTASWTAGYAKGTSRITLSSRTGMVPGKTPMILSQLDETDGYPAVGDIYLCDSGPPCAGNGGGAGVIGGTGTGGRSPAQAVLVTDCVSAGGVSQACSGAGLVDIDPPITMDNYRSAKTPQGFWEGLASNQATQWAGVEDLSLDYSGASGGDPVGVEIANATNVWVKGVRLIYTPDQGNYDVHLSKAVHVTIRSNYTYRPTAQGQSSYPMVCFGCGAILFENNICHRSGCGTVTTVTMTNSVVAYNFTPGNNGPGFINHGAGEVMNLVEGNVYKNVWVDITEGTKHFHTFFRNALIGNRYNLGDGVGCTEPACNHIHTAFHLLSHARFMNVVGNVIGDASEWSTYQGTSANGDCGTPVLMYDLGATGCSGGLSSPDARVAATLLRWMNWDEITSTSPTTNGDQTGTRACAPPLPSNCGTGNNGTGTPQNEVPSAITNFANPVPASQTLPSSLYLSTKPLWFQAQPWPGIGPDISGGTVTNLGGHVNLNPAAVCYLTTLGGAANGSSGVLAFNAAACYGAGNY